MKKTNCIIFHSIESDKKVMISAACAVWLWILPTNSKTDRPPYQFSGLTNQLSSEHMFTTSIVRDHNQSTKSFSKSLFIFLGYFSDRETTSEWREENEFSFSLFFVFSIFHVTHFRSYIYDFLLLDMCTATRSWTLNIELVRTLKEIAK